jgi:transposase, IS5 family
MMAQPGFFDHDRRLEALSAQGDPLVAINAMVPWETFRATIEAVVLTPAADRKSNAGRKPLDAVLKFKMLVLQSLYNLSDAQTEYQARDRLSFARFLGLGLEDTVPDATSLWLFREQLAKAGLIETLFDQFGQHLEAHGYIARGGQIVDATIVAVPKQRNERDENTTIKAGETPDGWAENPHKLAQKDRDARWTKKHGRSHFGYKNHVNVDAKHKLVRHYSVTDASVHDSRQLDGLLDRSNTSREVFADSAYRSAETEAKLRQQGFLSRIHTRAARNHPLSDAKRNANRRRSQVRVRIEHVFGAQETAPGGRLVRVVGLVRAKAKIGLQNLAYNIRRMAFLERTATVA